MEDKCSALALFEALRAQITPKSISALSDAEDTKGWSGKNTALKTIKVLLSVGPAKVVYYNHRVCLFLIEVITCFTTDQLGTVPAYSLPTGHLCARDLCWKGLPRAADCRWNHQHVFWASQSDGEMWPTPRKVHGLLSVVPRWCGTKGCERSHCHHQDQENHSICGLVPNWIQGEKINW